MKISRGWALYLAFLLVILGVGLSIPSLFTEFLAERMLQTKLDNFYIDVNERSNSIDAAIIDEVKNIRFDCSEHDMQILRDLNLYNSQFRVQGLELKNGQGCSSLGTELNILSSVVDKHYVYKLYGYDIGIATTNMKALGKSGETEGEVVVFINMNGNFIYWVLNSGWTHEQLQSPCKDCFYIEYFNYGHTEKSLFMPRGNAKIKLLPQDRVLAASMTKAGIVYRMLAGRELMSYAEKTLWFYSFVFMGIMFIVVTLIFWVMTHNQGTMTGLLRYGIQKKEFLPYYQPIVNARTGQVIGAEALLRWYHKSELVSPGIFIEHAEQYGLILDITEQILEKIILDLDKLPPAMWISVNVVPEQIENGSLFKMLQKHRWHYSSRLRFEITERMRVSDFDIAAREISKIKTLGYRFKLDDFGTGYGGFSYLQKLGVNEIKIDKMFVDTIGTNDIKKGILDSIIAFAKEADMDPVAEGVETQAQIDYLLAKGITHIQGFVYAQPMSLDELVVWIKESAPRILALHTQSVK
ncbi:EAL domain-containing protein [Plesiomonas shigelloides]|uniref:EAL domain-containing protein n=1 Tax=Plesiomonas shigelloides TaxID=703 RepID=UPI001C5B8845|nr:EAL domain-containing protein [Plesiomonas shigelloides]MBW3793073.1 EAL domain-containing protein [Plesiomonas shigelloides]MBW3794579.1 EAL domain-containing protein [Plesiomonas shigelloides]